MFVHVHVQPLYIQQVLILHFTNPPGTDGYNPEEPSITATSSTTFVPQPIIPPQPIPSLRPPFHPSPFPPGVVLPPPPSLTALPPPITSQASASSMFRPRRPPFGGPRYPIEPSDTLIIRKIPRPLNTITKLSSHFEKFGTIVNITVSTCPRVCGSPGFKSNIIPLRFRSYYCVQNAVVWSFC